MRLYICCAMILCATCSYASDTPMIIWDIHQTVYTSCETDLGNMMWNTMREELGYWRMPWGALYAAYRANRERPIRHEIIDALHDGSMQQPWTYYCNQPLPAIMASWLLGHTQTQEAMTHAKEILQNSSHIQEHTRTLAPYIIPLIFDPKKQVDACRYSEEAYELIRHYTSGEVVPHVRNIAYTNAHNDLIQELHTREKGHATLACFHTRYTSHDMGILRPQPAGIKEIAHRHGGDDAQCIVVDAEPQHHATFTSHNIPSVQYTTADEVRAAIDEKLDNFHQ